MLSTPDFVNIFLPVISHLVIWILFLVAVILVLLLYAYPYVRKPNYLFSFLSVKKFYSEKLFRLDKSKEESRNYHIGIPITVIISLYIFTKMLEGVIYQGSILKVDAWFNKIMIPLQSPWITNIAFFITSFGSGILLYILLIVTIGILFLRKRWRFALLSLVAISGAYLLQLIIKNLIHRARPLNTLEINSTFSFPSGHSIMAIAYVSLLIYSYKDDIKHTTTKYTLIFLASAFFITVGLTRIYLNVHWFSDVVAGMALGLSWFMFVVLVERSITGLISAVRKETKEAEPIKTAEIVKTAKKIIPEVLKKSK